MSLSRINWNWGIKSHGKEKLFGRRATFGGFTGNYLQATLLAIAARDYLRIPNRIINSWAFRFYPVSRDRTNNDETNHGQCT
jgi:hypothetical protein